jgi:hypothetical protein
MRWLAYPGHEDRRTIAGVSDGMRRIWSLGVCALIVLLASATAARQDALPPGRDLFARHVAAIGGEAAHRALKSIHAKGRLQIAAQGIAGEFELFSARPSRLLYRVTVPGIGVIENGYNGSVGWAISPIAAPELLSGRQLSEAADEAAFDAGLHLPEHIREATTVARETFDSRPAVKVRVVFRSGNEQMEFFDTETGLLIGTQATRMTAQGEVPTVNMFRDYKRFGAVLQATTFVQRALGFEQVVTITTCEFDVVPDAAFDVPAQIRALRGR